MTPSTKVVKSRCWCRAVVENRATERQMRYPAIWNHVCGRGWTQILLTCSLIGAPFPFNCNQLDLISATQILSTQSTSIVVFIMCNIHLYVSCAVPHPQIHSEGNPSRLFWSVFLTNRVHWLRVIQFALGVNHCCGSTDFLNQMSNDVTADRGRPRRLLT